MFHQNEHVAVATTSEDDHVAFAVVDSRAPTHSCGRVSIQPLASRLSVFPQRFRLSGQAVDSTESLHPTKSSESKTQFSILNLSALLLATELELKLPNSGKALHVAVKPADADGELEKN